LVYVLVAFGMARCHVGMIGRSLVKIGVAGSVLFYVLVLNLMRRSPDAAHRTLYEVGADEIPENLAAYFFEQPLASAWGLAVAVALILAWIVGIGVQSWFVKILETPVVVVGAFWLALWMGGGVLSDAAGERLAPIQGRTDEAVGVGKDLMRGIEEIQRQRREGEDVGRGTVPLSLGS
jgi:hypothetical protein